MSYRNTPQVLDINCSQSAMIVFPHIAQGPNLSSECKFFTFSVASRLSGLDKEIAVIALPALASLAADPIAGLVDTAYIGKLGIVAHFKF